MLKHPKNMPVIYVTRAHRTVNVRAGDFKESLEMSTELA